MCGRYYRRSDKQAIAEHFRVRNDLSALVLPDADYNVAPPPCSPSSARPATPCLTSAALAPFLRSNDPDKIESNFTAATMQPLIKTTPQQALWIRVSGQQMFDSEHFLKNHLVRVNNLGDSPGYENGILHDGFRLPNR
jgi:hypothetical protein